MQNNTVITNTKATSSQRVRLLTSTAIFAAMITLMTAYIFHVPIGANGGYIHLGDGLIYLAACLLPTPYALAAAAIGGGLADLLTAPIWAPATIIIKMLLTIPFTRRQDKIINVHNVLATVVAFFITGIGYYIAEAILMGGFEVGIIAALFGVGLIQPVGSAIVFIVLGVFLDRLDFKKKFLAE